VPRSRRRRTRPTVTDVLDLLGRRWALRIIWELREDPRNFRELQSACGGISASVLNTRLGELREAGIIEEGFTLTKEGHRLAESFDTLEPWAKRWARRAGF